MASPFNKSLSASSNLHLTAPSPYNALRESAVGTDVAKGYDFDSLIEISVD